MDVRENLQDKCNLEDLTYDDKIEYWHTHETGNSLREFLGMTEEKYLDFVLGKDKKITGKPKMDVREKLVDIIQNSVGGCARHWAEIIADGLIAHGVTFKDVPDTNVGEWISVKDRLPAEKVNCIVHYKHTYCENDDYWAIGICFYDGKKFQIDWAYKVTHWMPLPQPPKGE